MAYACIDIGSNTTRLLVAECHDGRLRELMSQRAFTRLGKGLQRGGELSPEKIESTAAVVARQARAARDLGVAEVKVVATAAIRDAANRDALVAAIGDRAAVGVEILSEADEARLSFVGATKTLGFGVDGTVAVVDIGGGSSEVAVGTTADGVAWFRSFPIGSGYVADAFFAADPPAADELESARAHVAATLDGLAAPPAERAVAVGGSATSLRKLVGAELSHEALERALALLCGRPAAEIARRFDVDPERARLLPAGVLILDELTAALGTPLTTGNGGLREGVILGLAAAAETAGAG